jgi:NAD(P)-dependent dehydrogenase (short-subunit alcohol dehydrogenase family)
VAPLAGIPAPVSEIAASYSPCPRGRPGSGGFPVRSVAGAVVVVTGGGSGIGAALSRRFAAEGASVVVNDINGRAAEAVARSCQGPGQATAVAGDAASEEGVAALITAARDRFGEIDVFCANAGVARGGGPEAGEPDWDVSWQVNVMAHVRAARLLIGPWLERGNGHLICTVSAAGLLSMPGSAPYSVTKHAALGFAEWMAITYAHRGLTVQAICPQGVLTPMLEGSDDRARVLLQDAAIAPEAVADAVIEGMAAGRFLILPHPDVADHYAGRATQTDRWLRGMSRLQQRLEELA